MNERDVPDNLKVLYDEFGREAIDSILTGEEFTLDGIQFICRYQPGSTKDCFYIAKPQALIDRYRDLLADWHPERILELGIAEGGSCAFLTLLAKPKKFVTIDLEPSRLPALDAFILARGLDEVIKPFYGVDQSDRNRLNEILDAELGDQPIDLVIDDASHDYELSRASFEILFPRVAPGGWYLIEDWSASLKMREAVVRHLQKAGPEERERFRAEIAKSNESGPAKPEPTSLTKLGIELAFAAGSYDSSVMSLSANTYFVAVQKGPEALDPEGFRAEHITADRLGLLKS
jgi:predicted O-methyltransferase YrrM